MAFVNTDALRVHYDTWGNTTHPAMVLLHGWPDSPRCWRQVGPLLAAQGFYVVAPALRGFGQTSFLDASAPRSGELAALGRDVVSLVAALSLKQPILVGHDWGARAASNAVGLAPAMARALVLISVGYATNLPNQALGMDQVQRYWYHWFMATAKGQQTVRANPKAFAQHMWDTWAPAGWYTPEEFAQTALAFDNPDWADITLHSYQHRWGHAAGYAQHAQDAEALDPPPTVNVPTLMLHGELDGASLPSSSAGKESFFTGPYERRVLPGIGHFPPREAPNEVAQRILDFVQRHAT